MFGFENEAEKCLISLSNSFLFCFVLFFLTIFYTDFFPVSALHGPSCGLDRIRIVNIPRN